MLTIITNKLSSYLAIYQCSILYKITSLIHNLPVLKSQTVKISTFNQPKSWIKSSSHTMPQLLLCVWIIFMLRRKLYHSHRLIKSKLTHSLLIIIIINSKSHTLATINSLPHQSKINNHNTLILNISDGSAI